MVKIYQSHVPSDPARSLLSKKARKNDIRLPSAALLTEDLMTDVAISKDTKPRG